MENDSASSSTARRGVADNVLAAIGGTPLIRLHRYLGRDDIDLMIKREASNPGGSAKDRPAAAMIAAGLADGTITRNSTIVESSSGNMGIGLAQACRFHGLPLIVVVDPRTQTQNVAIMRALGARIELVDQPVGGDFLTARLQRVQSLLGRIPGAVWTNQYANPANPASHQAGTVREIDEALDGEFDVLLVATSSTGTAQGCRNYLRARSRNVRVVAVDSVGSVLFGGSAGPRHIPGLGAGKMPPLAVGQRFDSIQRVTDLECVVGCRRAAATEAMLLGGSGGGILEVVRRMADELAGQRCVAVVHDCGSRYLPTVYDDDWVEKTLGASPQDVRQMAGLEPEAAGLPIGPSRWSPIAPAASSAVTA